MCLIKNKTYKINGNCSEPVKFLKSLPGVINAELLDQMSSAGDWSGYAVQELNGFSYLFTFSQENNWPKEGFTLCTSEFPIVKVKGTLSKSEIYQYLLPEMEEDEEDE
jgi:hypothetical protein